MPVRQSTRHRLRAAVCHDVGLAGEVHHRGHIIGNQYFPMVTVIAHEFAWKNMKSYGDSFRTRLLNLYRNRMPEAADEWKK